LQEGRQVEYRVLEPLEVLDGERHPFARVEGERFDDLLVERLAT